MRRQAVRILDFAHAAEHLTAIAETDGAARSAAQRDDRTRLLHALKHDGPDGVLTELRALRAAHPDAGGAGHARALSGAAGGAVAVPAVCGAGLADWQWEGGERQQAGGGRPAQRRGHALGGGNVNPMLALRNAVCNDRWAQDVDRTRGRSSGGGSPRTAAPNASAARRHCPQRQARQSRWRVRTVRRTPRPEPPTQAQRPAATHPWRRAWSIRQQRAAAGRLNVQECVSHPLP